MESTPRWIAVAVGVAMLVLGACSATGPTQARGEPVLRFSGPADHQGEGRDEHGAPARVRRDAHGRPIYFREIPLDRPGPAGDVHGTRRGNQGVRTEEKDDSAVRHGDDR